jgi:GNAT superfamily N-acetyltransferase
MKITVQTAIQETPRVLQVRGMFDLPPAKTSSMSWNAHLPLGERPWNIGLVVGPSGCGKSTIAHHLWPDAIVGEHAWPSDTAIVDGFPESLPTKELAEILSSVGFASPPAWLRPFHVLSTGQQFRVTLARAIAEAEALNPQHKQGSAVNLVFDEYTSVVDRTVAQVASHALQKTIRHKRLRFVAVTCHEDVEAWLNPDWVYRPAEQAFTWRLLQRRPIIEIVIVRCRPSAWRLFAPHHYLSAALARSATCFLATWNDRPVAFSAWLPFVGSGPSTRREHRTVTLPDFQGVGIGNAVSDTIASMWKALGYRAISTTTHPAMIRSRCRSPHWRMTRGPALASGREKKLTALRHATTRLTAGFEYIGPALPRLLALGLAG